MNDQSTDDNNDGVADGMAMQAPPQDYSKWTQERFLEHFKGLKEHIGDMDRKVEDLRYEIRSLYLLKYILLWIVRYYKDQDVLNSQTIHDHVLLFFNSRGIEFSDSSKDIDDMINQLLGVIPDKNDNET